MAVRRIHYFDTSAMMRLLMRERDGHQAASRAWLTAQDVVTVRVTYAETRAALAGARRNRSMTDRRYSRLKATWESLWPDVEMIDVDQPLMVDAARLPERYPLRGYDAEPVAAARRPRIKVLDLNSHN